MPIETLKKYLENRAPEFRHVMSVVFKGLAATAVRTDEGEFASLQADLARIEGTIEEDFAADSLLAATGGAMQTLGEYNQRTARLIRQRGSELQKMIAMLAESVLRITGSGERSQQALGEIQSNLKHAGGLQDLQKVKTQLSACLDQLCRESQRQREESQAAISELQRHIAQIPAPAAGPVVIDPVTGLKGRSAAENALHEAAASFGRKYVGVLVLDRLQSINARFGNEIGNQVLAELGRHTELSLVTTDSLFRWSGPALLALMPRQCTIDRIRSEVRQAIGENLGKEFDIGGRSVLIPIAPAWAVFGLVPPVSTIVKHIDAFVASQTTREYL